MAKMAMDLSTAVAGLVQPLMPIRLPSALLSRSRSLHLKHRRNSGVVLKLATSNWSTGNDVRESRRRVTIGVRAFATTQGESTEVLTQPAVDTRVPATILTGFLGSGKNWNTEMSKFRRRVQTEQTFKAYGPSELLWTCKTRVAAQHDTTEVEGSTASSPICLI